MFSKFRKQTRQTQAAPPRPAARNVATATALSPPMTRHSTGIAASGTRAE
jgi:hypothetical protein